MFFNNKEFDATIIFKIIYTTFSIQYFKIIIILININFILT